MKVWIVSMYDGSEVVSSRVMDSRDRCLLFIGGLMERLGGVWKKEEWWDGWSNDMSDRVVIKEYKVE